MATRSRSLIWTGSAAMAVLMLGFIVFANRVSRPALAHPVMADGIVVLTGAERRIEAGLQLLHEGLGRRLLISGINRRTSPTDLFRTTRTEIGADSCCIDFGYAARDTIGNASETKAWADRHHFTRLIVVTSSYHMPRSLNELALALPEVELIAFPVLPRSLTEGAWWLRRSATRILVAEYLKLIPSYARYAAHRLLRPFETPAALTSDRNRPRSAAL